MSSVVRQAPRFTEAEAARIAEEKFGVEAKAAPLPSERDQNFLLRSVDWRAADGRGFSPDQFVLKIANAEETFATLDLQNRIIEFLAARDLPLRFPRIVRTRLGEEICRIRAQDGREHFVRLFTWIEGTCLAELQPHGCGLLASLGHALGKMDAALAGFAHPAAKRDFYWDLRNAEKARRHIDLLPAARRRIVERVFSEWEKISWSGLRCSVIHNDANDYNVLVSPGDLLERQIAAILDYGDVVHTATVCELGVALAYAMLGKADAIGAASHVVAGYHEAYPLSEPEIEALYTLAQTRLAFSVCYAAYQTGEAPQNEYLNISNAPVWALLEQLSNVPLDWPQRVFRYACGFPVSGKAISRARKSAAELASARQKYLGPSLSLSYRAPLHIVCGSRQYLYDADGRRYLDCVNNVAHVGHSHPRVARAASEQMAVLNTNTRYLHENILEYVERLTETLPDPLRVAYLVCSGSEANELALRLARAHTGRDDVIVVEAAYHGNTNALIDLSPYKFDGPGGRGCPPHVHKTPLPDVYRGAHRGPDAGTLYAASVAEAARKSPGLAAFFCESAPSCAGQIILPPEYLREAYAAVRNAGGICVADEVQTGFGRAGTHFWMFETQGVVPDIVTLGKPIGNGHPLGAVITTAEIARSFANGMEYFNTFGGNPVSCTVGLEVLEIIRDEELQMNAHVVGEYLLDGIRQLQSQHPLIGDVRGLGLFLGIELVCDRDTREPAGREAAQLVEGMKERGVLLSTDGPQHNVIKIKPPLVFSRANADFLVGQLDVTLRTEFPR